MVPTTKVNSAPQNRPNSTTFLRGVGLQLVDQHVDADMDAGAHAIGGAELRHPHEHVDAELLRPGQVDLDRRADRGTGRRAVAMHDRDEDQQRRRRDQAGDQDFLEPIEDAKKHLRLAQLGNLSVPAAGDPELSTATAPRHPSHVD